ncbi:hypothetical protein [Winogradskyella sp. SYSU M77433]|uniref:hypothetical protein n=1 Tax=Winogradskyella sp. SYSU M77433 TaxID=3042722 RepID=UPI0024808BC7|nr:hypothetical protein [Winogradskyella sp. SYSU M77433]MDH7912213.1 hypothetical protein [Winogradskyella sp. SYSU M77433]
MAKNAVVNTINGNINVYTSNAKVIATSNNGTVVVDEFEGQQTHWQLKSINGNIIAEKE